MLSVSSHGLSVPAILLSLKRYAFVPICLLMFSFSASSQWSTTLSFDEPDWGAATAGGGTLVDADSGEASYTFDVDVVQPTGVACPGGSNSGYEEGMDGIDDIRVSINVFHNVAAGSNWNRDHLDFDVANDQFNHAFNISSNNSGSQEGDHSYAVIEFTFLNGLVVDSDNLCFESGSSNGASEMYEYGLFYVNGALNPAGISTYTNDDYAGCNGNTSTSMGNFLLGNIGTVSDGNIASGIFTDDELNTTIMCPPIAESAGTNPDSGAGSTNGVSSNGAGMGLAAGTIITSFTAVLGLHDVAYDTDGNGFTSSNTSPIARLNEICIGNSMGCPCTFPEPTITLDETCGTFDIVVGAIDESMASGTGTNITYATSAAGPFPGTAVTGMEALVADGTTQYWINIADAADADCNETFGPFTAPDANVPVCPEIEDFVACSGVLTTLDAGPGFTSYAWSNGATTQTTSVLPSATFYEVTVTDANGCTCVDQVHVIGRSLTDPMIMQSCTSTENDIYDLEVCFSATNILGSSYNIDVAGSSFGPFTYSSTSQGGGEYCVTLPSSDFDSADQAGGLVVTIMDQELFCGVAVTYDEEDCPNYDLALTKGLVSTGPFYPGQQIEFEIDVINQGDLDAYNVCILDLVPTDLAFTAADNTAALTGNVADWTSSAAGPKLILPVLAAGATEILTIFLDIIPEPTGTDLLNTATISGAEDIDGNPIADRDDDLSGPLPDPSEETDDEILDNPSDVDHFDFAFLLVCLLDVDILSQEVCEGDEVEIQPSIINGTAPYTYSWAGPDGFTSTGSSVILSDVVIANSGTYSVTITDANGCVNEDMMSLTINPNPIVEIDAVEPQCILDDPLTLVASPTGGTFSGNGVISNQFYPGNAGAGEHTIYYTFVDGNSCSTTESMIIKVQGGDNLSCKGDLNLSLDENCSLGNIGIELFLADHLDPDLYDYILEDGNGNVIDIEDIGQYAGDCITYTVVDKCSANSCWGNVCLEDKISPTNFNCACETPFLPDGTPDPECTYYCYDIWDLEILEEAGGNNEVLPSPNSTMPEDNCLDFEEASISLSIVQAGGCDYQQVTRTLKYYYPDITGELQEIVCVQRFLFTPLSMDDAGTTFNGVWDGYPDYATATGFDAHSGYYLPEQTVKLPCGYDLSPESIAEYYDIDSRLPEGVENDDYTETPSVVEHNEGIPYAYPYVVVQGWDGHHAKPIINNICSFYAVYEDQINDACGSDCSGGLIIGRTWNFVDWCTGETGQYIQQISSHDKEGPVIGNPDITVSTDPWECVANVEMPEPEHLHDECDPNATWYIIPPIGYNVIGNTIIGLPKGVHPAIYVGVDCCGNESSYTVLINVIDQAPPVAIAKQDIVVNLSTVIGSDGVAKIYAEDIDNFSHDACGPVKLEVRRADGNIWCHPGNGTFNDDGHLYDDPDDDDDGAFVVFCCEDIALNQDSLGNFFGEYEVVLRVWDDGDMNGIFGTIGDNYNETWSTIRVEDKLIPTVICPPTAEITCDVDFNDYDQVGEPLAFTPCGDFECNEPSDLWVRKPANQNPFMGEDIPAYNQSCRRGAIRRTWNCNGNTCTQWIIVRERDTPELIIEWPNDTIINCLSGETDEPKFLNDICELYATNLEVDTFLFEEDACYKLLKKWTVINWCDYDLTDSDLNDFDDPTDDGVVPGFWQHTQVVKLFDEDDPILLVENQRVGTNADCVTEGGYISAIATDEGACASDWIKWDVEVDLWGDGDIDYFYSSGLPPSDPYYIGPTLGQGSFVDSMLQGSQVQVLLPDGIKARCGVFHKVEFSAYDGCGNVTRQTKTLEIVDSKAPTPYMVDANSALMSNGSVELWASDFNIGSFDNCNEQSELWYSFSSHVPPQVLNSSEPIAWYDENGVASQALYLSGDAEKWNPSLGSSSRVFTCDDLEEAVLNGGYLELQVYAWDPCGNSDFAIVQLSLLDNNNVCNLGARATISGRVVSEAGEGIEDLMIDAMSDQPNYPRQQMTDNTGLFAFDNNPMYNDYILTGEKRDDWLNGVTTLDIVIIQKHILGIEEFTSPYKLIAADVSNDERVSGVDLVVLRKAILGVFSEFPDNDSWRIIDATQNLDSSQPWPFNESLNVGQLDQDEMQKDFIGVKIGDVNDNAVANINSLQTESRSGQTLIFNIEDMTFEAEDEVELEITSENFEDIAGFQFTLETKGLELLEVIPGAIEMSEENLVQLSDNYLTTSWNTNKPMTVGDETLFTIRFKSKVASSSSQMFTLNDDITFAEAYTGNNYQKIQPVLNGIDNQIENFLAQNEPNPWSTSTMVNFGLAKKGLAVLTIFDLTGKVIYRTSDTYEAGIHQVQISKRDLNTSSSVLYFKLESGGFTQTNKMIMIE